MSIYNFVMRDRCGEVEELGDMALSGDKEAIAFAKAVVREMTQGSPTSQVGSIMVVSNGLRAVGKIRLRIAVQDASNIDGR
jgi:hypothetical protein